MRSLHLDEVRVKANPLDSYLNNQKSEGQLSASQEKIDELNRKLLTLKEKRNILNAEAKGLMEKRDNLNQKSRQIHAEIQQLKAERDSCNARVKELKSQRTELNAKIGKKIEEIKKLKLQIRTLAQKRPSKTLQQLQKEIQSIEWKIQTTLMDLQEEKELVGQVRQLGTQLSVQKKLEDLNMKIIELQAELKAFETTSKHCHEQLMQIAQSSQEIHEKMMNKVGEAKQAKTEADGLHKLFLDAREKAKPINQEIEVTLSNIGLLKGEIRAIEEEQKKKKEKTLLEKLEKQAREKLKRGEKLSWEEFQLLVEKGLTAQD